MYDSSRLLCALKSRDCEVEVVVRPDGWRIVGLASQHPEGLYIYKFDETDVKGMYDVYVNVSAGVSSGHTSFKVGDSRWSILKHYVKNGKENVYLWQSLESSGRLYDIYLYSCKDFGVADLTSYPFLRKDSPFTGFIVLENNSRVVKDIKSINELFSIAQFYKYHRDTVTAFEAEILDSGFQSIYESVLNHPALIIFTRDVRKLF